MSAVRIALLIGAIPIAVGVIYLVLQQLNGTEATVDPAGVLLLLSLGVAMGFGFMVILRGARDL